jgi:hypothetical protein
MRSIRLASDERKKEMKILMTGYSAPQVGSTRSPISREITPQALASVLARTHDVRIEKFAEADPAIKKADLLILFLTPPHNLLSRNAATGILNAFQRLNKPVLAFFDDWQVKQVVSGHRTVGKHALVRVKRVLGGGPNDFLYGGDKRYQEEHHEDITTVCKIFDGASPWPARWHWACPMYPWGKHELIFNALPNTYPRERFHAFDPSTAWDLPVQRKWNPLEKQPRWMLTSLLNRSDWLAKQHLDWPVDMAGNRKVGSRFKSEADVMEEVGARWGTLSPVYNYATGCGWYRSRFKYAAATGSVLYADAREVQGMPGYHINANEIENASYSDLVQYASMQAAIFRANVWSRKRMERELNSLVQEVVS